MKINAGRQANKEMVVREEKGQLQRGPKDGQNANFVKKAAKDDPEEQERRKQAMLNVTAETAEQYQRKLSSKEKRKAAFGWDVFNQDSLLKVSL